MKSTKKIILFDTVPLAGDTSNKVFTKNEDSFFYCINTYLTQRGYNVQTLYEGDPNTATAIVFTGYAANNKYFKKAINSAAKDKLYLYLFEPPVVDPRSYRRGYHSHFSKIFTYIDSMVDNRKYQKFYHPISDINDRPSGIVPFAQKNFSILINANKYPNHLFYWYKFFDKKNALFQIQELYTARRQAILYFEAQHPDDLDLYGPGWNKPLPGLLRFIHSASNHNSYKGMVKDKLETMQKYKFCLCYENNSGLEGYITEKIFDCFKSNCIPIYWGASNIQNHIPSDCYIDKRKYNSYHALYNYLCSITGDEYDNYINRINNFLHSKTMACWTYDAFAENLLRAIEN